MGIVNPLHLFFIAIVALIVLGPKRMPEVARSLGNGYRQFRDSLSEVTHLEPDVFPAVNPSSPVAAPAVASTVDERPPGQEHEQAGAPANAAAVGAPGAVEASVWTPAASTPAVDAVAPAPGPSAAH